MPYYCITILAIFMYIACSSKYSRKNHRVTFILNDSLFVEKFKVFSGSATTSDSYSYYLTDSLHFRKYIGTEDNNNEQQIFWNHIKLSNEIIIYLATRDLEQGAMEKLNYIDKTEKDPDRALKKMSAIKIVNDTTKIGDYYIQDLVKEGKFE